MSTLERLKDYEIRSEYGSETLKYDIAAILVAARKMKNLTQIALANIAGVSQAYIAKLESGEANPTIGRIGAILASIWLKAEIDLVPIMPGFDTEIAEQRNTNQAADDNMPTRGTDERKQWLNIQQSHQGEQFTINIMTTKRPIAVSRLSEMVSNAPMLIPASRTSSDIGTISHSPLAQQGNIFTNSNDALAMYK